MAREIRELGPLDIYGDGNDNLWDDFGDLRLSKHGYPSGDEHWDDIDWEYQRKIQPSWNRPTEQTSSTDKNDSKARDGIIIE